MNSSELKILQDKLIKTLEVFDRFCAKNNLKYSIAAGTALGAIRHKGIIPWDDDVDVCMLREDYERLLSIKVQLNDTHYYLACPGDYGYIYPFAKFCDGNTSLIECEEYPDCLTGIYIDIFPLDEIDDCTEVSQHMRNIYMKLYVESLLTYRKYTLRFLLSSLYHRKFETFKVLLKNKNDVRKRLADFEKEWSKAKGERVYCHRSDFNVIKASIPKIWMDSLVDVNFGNICVKCLANYHEYLTALYGDYMTPPPLEKQISHHSHYYLNLKEGLSRAEIQDRLSKGEHLVI